MWPELHQSDICMLNLHLGTNNESSKKRNPPLSEWIQQWLQEWNSEPELATEHDQCGACWWWQGFLLGTNCALRFSALFLKVKFNNQLSNSLTVLGATLWGLVVNLPSITSNTISFGCRLWDSLYGWHREISKRDSEEPSVKDSSNCADLLGVYCQCCELLRDINEDRCIQICNVQFSL